MGISKQFVTMDVADLIPYEKNPRKIPQTAIDDVCESYRQCGVIDPIEIDENNVILSGHTRRLAALEVGIKKVDCLVVSGLTEEQKRKYRILANKTGERSEWDYELLEWELEDLDFEGYDFGFEVEEDSYEEEEHGKLTDQFIVPPFSVLDARQGYWKKRKSSWLKKTGNLSETRDGDFGTIANGKNNMLAQINGGTSNFDPVLAETMMKWFCISGGHILDPFGGEQTKGVVAGECGYRYTAVEIRQEQVDTNNRATKDYPDVTYICGDSNNISKLVEKRGFDFCFTSPPYYDLEVYSKEDMSALGTYEEFMEQYYNIFQQCYDMLDNDTFLCVKVGEIRDKKTGIYRNFVGDNISTMCRCGFKYYNEIILVTSAGTLPLRVGQSMKSRKVGKMHQNVLVFYKGDPKNISDKYPVLNFDGLEVEDDE